MAGPALPHITIQNRAALRDWLGAHHNISGNVWLVTHRRPHPDHLPYETLVEELLCELPPENRTVTEATI